MLVRTRDAAEASAAAAETVAAIVADRRRPVAPTVARLPFTARLARLHSITHEQSSQQTAAVSWLHFVTDDPSDPSAN